MIQGAGIDAVGVAAYSINPYSNCAYKCQYCYLKDKHGDSFGRASYPNHDVLNEIQTRRYSLESESWILSALTDPYPRIEQRERITRGVLHMLAQIDFRQGIVVTKSAGILEDIPWLEPLKKKISIGISITTDIAAVAAVVEPRSIPPADRFMVAKSLRAAGFEVRILVSPALRHSAQFAESIATSAGSVFVDPVPYLRYVDQSLVCPVEELQRFHGSLKAEFPAANIIWGRHHIVASRLQDETDRF